MMKGGVEGVGRVVGEVGEMGKVKEVGEVGEVGEEEGVPPLPRRSGGFSSGAEAVEMSGWKVGEVEGSPLLP